MFSASNVIIITYSSTYSFSYYSYQNDERTKPDHTDKLMLYFPHIAIQKCLSILPSSSLSSTLLLLLLLCRPCHDSVGYRWPHTAEDRFRSQTIRFEILWLMKWNCGRVFCQYFCFFCIIIPPMLALIFIYTLYLAAGETYEAWEFFKKQCTVYNYLVQISQRTYWDSVTKTRRL